MRNDKDGQVRLRQWWAICARRDERVRHKLSADVEGFTVGEWRVRPELWKDEVAQRGGCTQGGGRKLQHNCGPEPRLGQWPGTGGAGWGDEKVISVTPRESQQWPCPSSQNDSHRASDLKPGSMALVPKPGQDSDLHVEVSGTVRLSCFHL